ncbi:MAG: EH signature domain-containing protein [bacterium]|nr:EH signature domain-containing protein [bacterium]
MNAQAIETSIQESLKQWPIKPPLPALTLSGTPALDRALAELDAQESARPMDLDEARLLAVIQRVEEHHLGRGTTLTRRELGRLAWAFDHGHGKPLHARPSFTTALGLFQEPLRPRILLGLIEGYWRTSCQDEQRLDAWAHLIARGLEGLAPGKSEVLDHWRRCAGLVFAPGRTGRLSVWLWETRDPRSRLASLWPDPAGSPRLGHRLVQEGLEAACQGLPVATNAPDLQAIEVLVTWLESLIQDARQDHVWLKRALEIVLVRLADAGQVQPIRSLLSLVIRLFNDPRLATGQSWGDIDARATQLVVGWLARRDLEFFFRALARSMDSRRHAFWMGYIDQITYTRLVLGDDVYVDPAYRAEFQKERREGRHAQMKSHPQLAALIVKIGKLTLVEFSQTGNAAYWYLDPLPIDLHASQYSVNDLKVPMRYVGPSPGGEISVQDFLVGTNWKRYNVRAVAENRFTHGGSWQGEVASYLAELGIRRPVSKPSASTTRPGQPGAGSTVNVPSTGRWKTTAVPPVAAPVTTPPKQPGSHTPAQTSRPSPEKQSPGSAPPAPKDRALDLVLDAMKEKGLEIVDMRKVGGAVWMLPGPELEFFLSRLELQGLVPRWVPGGGTATNHRPAYYVKVN